MKEVKKKGVKSKCSYFKNGFHPKNNFFKMNLDIMSNFLENYNIEFPDEIEKHVESSEHCHRAQSQGNIKYSLSDIFKYLPHISDIDSFYDIS